MPLGTLDRSPPSFFRQGPSALTKLAVCSALALFLMVADRRLSLVGPLRATLATVLLPVQRALRVPVEIVTGGSDYLLGLEHAQRGEREARAALLATAHKARRADLLESENAQLRSLLGLDAARLPGHLAAEVLFEASDAFSYKLVIDRGQRHGVVRGSPVVDAAGVLGQVTRVYPLSSEVTLVIDKDAAIPVLNQRTQQPAAAFGGVRGPDGLALELRFLPANADVLAGDLLATGGLDGVYPPGLPVARVARVERAAEGGFASVLLEPVTRGHGARHVLVLSPAAATPVELDAAATAAGPATPASAPASAAKRGAARAASAAGGLQR